jgi:hypothetical protein
LVVINTNGFYLLLYFKNMRRSFLFSLLVATAAASPTAPHPLAYRADADTAVVNLGLTKGKPQHLASGFIYGIPDTPNQVADHWYTDMGFNYARVGGMGYVTILEAST